MTMPYGGAGTAANPSQFPGGSGSNGGITGPVIIGTSGSTFAPVVTLVAGTSPTVTWACQGFASQTGLTPSFSFGSAAARTVTMTATDSSGRNALSQIATFNVGYDHTLDASPYAPSSAFDHAQQNVTSLTNVYAMTNLVYLLAEQNTGLTGQVDCSGMGALTNIELYGSVVTSVITAGCTSLIRLDVELNDLTALDLNSIPQLTDLRAAAQNNSSNSFSLNFALTAINQPSVYHFCTRDQIVTNMPSLANMTTAQQLYIWNSQQWGIFKPNSNALYQVQAYLNGWASADLTNQFPIWHNAGACQLDLHSCALASVTLTGCPGLNNIDLHGNQTMGQAMVDSILAAVDGFGTSNGTLNLGTTAQPSGAGATSKANLVGRGWTVTTDSSGIGGVGTHWTYGETTMGRWASAGAQTVTLQRAVASGDLLVAMIEAPGTPKVNDSSGNTWTVAGPFDSFSYLAYCTSAAAASGGVTIAAWNTGPVGMIASRFTPTGVITFGGSAHSTPDAGGLNFNASQNLGNLGTVAAHALAWGAWMSDTAGALTATAGFQTGSSGTVDVTPGPGVRGANGIGFAAFVPDCANANASLTWFGNASGIGGKAVSAYFTST